MPVLHVSCTGQMLCIALNLVYYSSYTISDNLPIIHRVNDLLSPNVYHRMTLRKQNLPFLYCLASELPSDAIAMLYEYLALRKAVYLAFIPWLI
jgi:hypothetical protein